MYFCNIFDQTILDVVPIRYGSTYAGTWTLDKATHIAHGVRLLEALPVVPDGHRLASLSLTQDPMSYERALMEYTTEKIPPEPPAMFPNGIEIGLGGALEMAAQADGAVTYGYIPAPDGALLPYIAHASPRPTPEETQARKDEAVAKHAAKRSDVLARADSAKGAAAAAGNSLPALRAVVAELAAIIERMLAE